MIRPVIKRGDPILLQPTREVVDLESIKELVTDLWDTLIAIQGLRDFTRGSGIAANQIGEPWRVDILEFEGQRYTLINPRITSYSEEKVPVREGCLSFFDFRGLALRYADVTVTAVDLDGTPFTISSDGDLNKSSILQHELGHLDGELYDSHLAHGEELVKMPDMPAIP
ncbi:MAG TPA: peptide deformylase [Candidatus Saccharimonadales bacterium]